MFQHQGAILREYFQNKVIEVQHANQIQFIWICVGKIISIFRGKEKNVPCHVTSKAVQRLEINNSVKEKTKHVIKNIRFNNKRNHRTSHINPRPVYNTYEYTFHLAYIGMSGAQLCYMGVLVVGYTNTSKWVCVQLTWDAIDFKQNWLQQPDFKTILSVKIVDKSFNA